MSHLPGVDRKTSRDVLVLSGGGLFGAAQVGMLDALAGTGWTPDAIVGVSAGALNGCFVACGFSRERVSQLSAIWDGIDERGIFPTGTLSQFMKIISRAPSVQNGAELQRIIARCSPVEDLADTPIDLHVGATDIATGKAVWFNAGPAVPALLASASVPALVPPVKLNGKTLVDGAVASNIPVLKAVDVGATRIVCLDVAKPQSLGLPTTALSVLLKSFSAAVANVAEHEVAMASSEVEQLWRVSPHIPDDLGGNDWHRIPELRDLGASAMRSWLATHRTELCGETSLSTEKISLLDKVSDATSQMFRRTALGTR